VKLTQKQLSTFELLCEVLQNLRDEAEAKLDALIEADRDAQDRYENSGVELDAALRPRDEAEAAFRAAEAALHEHVKGPCVAWATACGERVRAYIEKRSENSDTWGNTDAASAHEDWATALGDFEPEGIVCGGQFDYTANDHTWEMPTLDTQGCDDFEGLPTEVGSL
jgi:hypothetical protein